MMPKDIQTYHDTLDTLDQEIAYILYNTIDASLPDAEAKVWHGHPVWFLEGNPITGYSKQKAGLRLMFWSGADFITPGLDIRGEKFKDASVFYKKADEIDTNTLKKWLAESRNIQWDYKNIVKRKGVLERLK